MFRCLIASSSGSSVIPTGLYARNFTIQGSVVSQGAGGKIFLWTERSLIDGSVRTLEK